MYDKIDPLSEEFGHLKQFCFRIGEGRLEPQVEEHHFFYLYHPTVEGAFLIVYWDADHKHFYIREPIEGFDYPLEQYPLVHSFPLEGRKMFPSRVEFTEDRQHVLYFYEYDAGPEGAHIIETCTMKQYLRLEMLFDEKNPIPWKELK